MYFFYLGGVMTDLRTVLNQLQKEYFFEKKQSDFAKAFERISARYRQEAGCFLQTDEERKAYLFTRLPATFAVALKVLEEVQNRCNIESLLDVGAGPGTGMWAASTLFSELTECFLLEKDPLFMQLGKELVSKAEGFPVRKIEWRNCDIEKEFTAPEADLVLLSYSIGETKQAVWPSLAKQLWSSTKKALVIIEPGTPKGYDRLMKLRDVFLNLGGYLWAPCPHSNSCPLKEGDWCHFPARVARSSLHRQLKSAELGYEDEKFSYLIIGKEPSFPYLARVIRKPSLHSGWIEFTTCQSQGVEKEVFTRKQGEEYKKKKRLDWGDCF